MAEIKCNAEWRKGVPPDSVGLWLRKPHRDSPHWVRNTVGLDYFGNLRLFRGGMAGDISGVALDDERLKYPEWWWYGPILGPPTENRIESSG